MNRPWIRALKPGDKVVRVLAGIEQTHQVREVKEDRIVTDAVERDGTGLFRGGWEFCRATGAEIDDDLRWGPQYGATGSYIKEAE